jgi:hypothetical protein
MLRIASEDLAKCAGKLWSCGVVAEVAEIA